MGYPIGGQQSADHDWAEVWVYDPEVIVISPADSICGGHVPIAYLPELPGWK